MKTKRDITMRTAKWFFVSLSIVFIIGIISSCARERLQYIGEDIEGTLWYIDKINISYLNKDVVRMWVIKKPAKGSKNFLEIQNRLKKIGKNYTGFAFEGSLYDFDCSKSKYNLLSVVSYDNDDKIIASDDYDDYKRWHFIYPGTMMELVKENVCGKVRRG